MSAERPRGAVRAVLAMLVLGALSACATTGGDRAQTVVPAGATVVLERALQLPPGSARVHIQGGRVVDEGDINRFVAACSFGLRRQGDEALVRTIRPGRFDTGSSRWWGEAGLRDAGGIRVAANGWRWLASNEEGGGIVHLTYRTEIPLSAPDQPQVDDLTCRFDAEPGKGPLTVAQIREALGDIASIRLPGE